MQLTSWFDPGVKPFRIGVYETGLFTTKSYQYWDGDYWWNSAKTPSDAFYGRKGHSWLQNPNWRGLCYAL